MAPLGETRVGLRGGACWDFRARCRHRELEGEEKRRRIEQESAGGGPTKRTHARTESLLWGNRGKEREVIMPHVPRERKREGDASGSGEEE